MGAGMPLFPKSTSVGHAFSPSGKIYLVNESIDKRGDYRRIDSQTLEDVTYDQLHASPAGMSSNEYIIYLLVNLQDDYQELSATLRYTESLYDDLASRVSNLELQSR